MAYKSAKELGLDTGEAVKKSGTITVIPRKDEIAPTPMARPQGGSNSQVVLKTTYLDRSQGFLVGSLPMWGSFTASAALIAHFFAAIPFVSVTMVGIMFTGAIVAWITSWMIHTIVSPDGTAIIQALLGYKLIRHEQNHRYGIKEKNNE